MIGLRLSVLNLNSPYKIWNDNNGYHFITDNGIAYVVEFDFYDIPISDEAYWFNLYNLSGKDSPHDVKLQKTIVCIVEEFFRQNPHILLYMCDTAENQQAARSRLFLRWFNLYGHKHEFIMRSAVVRDEDMDNYITLIVQKSNPKAAEILATFDEQIGMFKENK